MTTGCILGRVPVLPVLQSDRHHEGEFPNAGCRRLLLLVWKHY